MPQLKILTISFLISLNSFAQPTADFDKSSAFGCIVNTVTFTDLSVDAVEWAWDFGDGTTSDEENPTHVFESVGTKTITLVVTDAGGLTDSHSETYIVRAPLADFNLSPSFGCSIPHTVFFTDESSFPDTWSWNFGDGGTSSAQNPIHTFTSAGTYNMTLTVVDTNFGCSSIKESTVQISELTAEFSGSSTFGCAPITTTFTNESGNIGAGSIDSYLWDFGDGTTSAEENPSHLYDSHGTFHVSLTITNDLGCSKTQLKSYFVQTIGPDVDFEADVTATNCKDFEVNFTDNTVSGSPIVSWDWNFGDGGSAAIENPIHSYTDYGVYDVSLEVSDLDGCSRTLTFEDYISVQDSIPPVFDICPSNQIGALTEFCQFTLTDYTLLATVSDNCTDPLLITQTPTPGTIITSDQEVVLEIVDENDSTATCSFSVLLFDDINPTITCPGDQNVSFDSDCAYTLLDYTGMASSTDNCAYPTVTQSPSAGILIYTTQTITLSATDTAGNTASCTFDIIPTDDTPPEITCPSDISAGNDLGMCGALITYATPVGTDNCSATTTLIDGFATGSLFPLGTTSNTYSAIDDSGLSTTCTFDVTIIDVELPEIVCPSPISVNNDPAECGALISFSNPTITDNCPDILLEQLSGMASDIIFPIGTTTNSYEVTDNAGNSATCSFDVEVIDAENPTISCPENQASCDEISTYSIPPATDNCEILTVELIAGIESGSAFPLGITTNTFETTDLSGNTATCTFTIERFEVPVVNAGADQIIDAGFNTKIDASTSIAGTFEWSPIDGLSDPLIEDPLAAPEQATIYTLTVTTTNGCEASDEVEFKVGLDIEINNFMSPNGDGKNDTWIIKGNYLLDEYNVKIIDSWGNLIIESQGYDNSWDGTREGEQLQQGVYYYIIDSGVDKILTGGITLIR